MQVCERTECELQMTDVDLFVILRKMGYGIPEDANVAIYCTKLAKKAGASYNVSDDAKYRLKLKWTKVVRVDPKPIGGFIL